MASKNNGEKGPVDIEFLIRCLAGLKRIDSRSVQDYSSKAIQCESHSIYMSSSRVHVQSGHSRPGILVLVNDTDWELEGEGGYELKEGDEIVFISTLHRG